MEGSCKAEAVDVVCQGCPLEPLSQQKQVTTARYAANLWDTPRAGTNDIRMRLKGSDDTSYTFQKKNVGGFGGRFGGIAWCRAIVCDRHGIDWCEPAGWNCQIDNSVFSVRWRVAN